VTRELLDDIAALQWEIEDDKHAEAAASAKASEKKGWFGGSKKNGSANPGVGAGE